MNKPENNVKDDQEEFDNIYAKQSLFSTITSIVLLVVCIIGCFVLMKLMYPLTETHNYEGPHTIDGIVYGLEKTGDTYSLIVVGMYEGNQEIHTFEIDKLHFMTLKENDPITIEIRSNNTYRIVE